MKDLPHIENHFGITISELKQILESWPDENNGEQTEVWVGDRNGLSNPVKAIRRLGAADLIFEY